MQRKLETNEALLALDFDRYRTPSSQERPFPSHRLLLNSLSLVGLYSRSQPLSSLSSFSMAIIVLLFGQRSIFLVLSFGEKYFWSAVVDFLRAISAFHVALEMFSKRKLLVTCLWQSLPVLESKRETKTHERVETIFKYLVPSLWLYIAIRLFRDITTRDLNDYFGVNFRGAPALAVVHLTLDRLLVTGATTFGILLYLLFCITTISHIKLYNRFFGEMFRRRVSLSPEQLRHWTHNRVRLQQTVREVEDLLSLSVFLWYGLYGLSFCFNVVAILGGSYPILDAALDMIYLNVSMVAVSLAGSHVWENAEKSAALVHNYLSLSETVWPWAHVLALVQRAPEMAVSAAGFFWLSRGLVFSIWVSVATYVLIIVSWRG